MMSQKSGVTDDVAVQILGASVNGRNVPAKTDLAEALTMQVANKATNGADTETYRAKGNPRNVEHAKGGPHMFDSTEILRHSGAGAEKWLTRLRQGNKAYGLPCYGPAA